MRLRLILLAFGIFLVIGLYLFDRMKKRQQQDQRHHPAAKNPVSEPKDLEGQLQQLGAILHADRDTGLDTPAKQLKPTLTPPRPQSKPSKPNEKIILLHLLANDQSFSGTQLQKVIPEVDLKIDPRQVFVRRNAQGKILFHVANMIAPGSFPMNAQEMAKLTTRGLVLFTQLPGPDDSLAIFSDMLFTAERLAALLDGKVCDERRQLLTKPTIERLRAEIITHQQQLKRSQAVS